MSIRGWFKTRFESLKDWYIARRIRKYQYGNWVVYRFNENRDGGRIDLGVLSRAKALQEAREFGKVVKVDDDFCMIFINDEK